MRRKYIVFLLIIFSFINISASSGKIKQDSIIECNGKYYGNHGNPIHWHMVEKKDDVWVSISKEVDIPSCYIKVVNEKELVSFSKCVDGDTAKFIVNNEERTVRFLAIDTPEIASGGKEADLFGNEASDFTCQKLKQAKEIYLEYDSNSDKEDKYNRLLAFVHVDGVLLEKLLIEQGLARVYYIYGDYNYVDELRKAEEISKEKKLGIWSDKEIATPDVKEDNKDKKIEEELSLYDLIIMILKKLFDLLLN